MVSAIANKRIRLSLVLLLGLTVSALTGCGIIQGDHASGGNGVVVTPANADVRTGDTVQFSAQVTGGGAMVAPPSPPDRRLNRDEGQRHNFMGNAQPKADAQVLWSVNGIAGGNATVGAISDKGLYTAPALLPDPTSVHVTATS